MAVNPMQRKIRNSFLLGVLVTMLIAAIVIVLLVFKIKNMNEEKAKEEKNKQTITVSAYVLNQSVTSGTIVFDGANNNLMTLKQVESLVSPSELLTAEDLTEYIDSLGVDVYNVLVSKIDLPANTILTKNMLEKSTERITKDVRKMEYNMFVLPSRLEADTYVDIRLLLPTGEDLIVASKKYVVDCNASTIWLNVTEGEILTIDSAIVDAYILGGSKLYVTEYAEAGNQEAANTTYTPSNNTQALIEKNLDIVDEAKTALRSRWDASIRENLINSQLNQYTNEERQSSVEAAMDEEIESIRTQREEFLGEVAN